MDKYDYRLEYPQTFSDIPPEKIMSLLKDTTNTVSLDIDMLVEGESRKVVQVDQSIPVNDLLYKIVPSVFSSTFKDIPPSLLESLWLFIDIKGLPCNLPLLCGST